MLITVASGKGGTGKTTVAVSLALSLAGNGQSAPETGGQNLTFLDCDVEEPNAHLFLKPTIEHREDFGILTPQVDARKCTLCGRCAEVCQYHALAVLADQVIVFPELCHGCGSCLLNCPARAIEEAVRPTGRVEKGHAGTIAFSHAYMNVGEAMSTPLIRALKRDLRQEMNGGVAILDAPPGTACPVVECLKGADFALMVTEPTPFGLHDLRMAIDVARHELGIPVGVVVNRADLGDSGVDEYCNANQVPILMRIPLDRRIAEVCADGNPLVKAFPEYRHLFLGAYARILEEVGQ